MGLSPPIMNDILTLDENASYNLRSGVKEYNNKQIWFRDCYYNWSSSVAKLTKRYKKFR